MSIANTSQDGFLLAGASIMLVAANRQGGTVMAKAKAPRAGGGQQHPEDPGLVERLREAIRDSGESLNHLGERAGVGRDRLSRFLRGERGLTLDAAEKLCRALGLRLTRAEDKGPQRGGGVTWSDRS